MKHLVFDTETTGLIKNSQQPLKKQPYITEFFGVILDDEKDFEEVATFSTLIKPPIVISQEIINITGITNEMVADAPTFGEVAGDLWQFIHSADAIVAHNLFYDMNVVDFELKRAGTLFSIAASKMRKVCTVEETEHLKGFRVKLIDLHTMLFGHGFEAAHRAENDVRALQKCYIELKRLEEI